MRTDPIIFGHNLEQRIVAVYAEADTVHIWTRSEDGRLHHRTEPFYSYFWTDSETAARAVKARFARVRWCRLKGDGAYRHLLVLEHRADALSAAKMVQQMGGRVYELRAPEVQYLTATGRTLFKGMDFNDVRRMQLDIEVVTSGGFPDARRADDKVVMIGLMVDGQPHILRLDEFDGDEARMLDRWLDLMAELDPDVIEGHNIFSFDLPYLEERCRMYGLDFSRLSRVRGAEVRKWPMKKRSAERMVEYQFYQIPGRHVIDTYFAALDYDSLKRSFQSYSLKEIARQLGVAREGRVYLEGTSIVEVWKNQPDVLAEYLIDDLQETRDIAEQLLGAQFASCQIVPMPYQHFCLAGTGLKVELLLVREYLRQRHALPVAPPRRPYEGAYTDVFVRGVVGPVVYADVASLYPSIMLYFCVRPRTDTLGVFQPLLRALTDMRLEWKRLAKTDRRYDSMQAAAKILINSFYGYLGYAGALFGDVDEAERVTATGRAILRRIIAALARRGCRVVEVDTDGVYFVPPEGGDGHQIIAEVNGELPEGIRLEHDGDFVRMLSYKSKNYVLLKPDGSLKVKGGAFLNRSKEPLIRELIERAVRYLLEDDLVGLRRELHRTLADLRARRVPVDKLVRVATLHESLEEYERKVEGGHRNRAAAYELARRWEELTGRRATQGTRIEYYVPQTDVPLYKMRSFEVAKLLIDAPETPDYHVEYYVRKVVEAVKAFLADVLSPSVAAAIVASDQLFDEMKVSVSMFVEQLKTFDVNEFYSELEEYMPHHVSQRKAHAEIGTETVVP